jgi:hypothetical protein
MTVTVAINMNLSSQEKKIDTGKMINGTAWGE